MAKIHKMGESEVFQSCYAACLQCGYSRGEAGFLSGRVTFRVRSWLSGQGAGVHEDDVFDRVVSELKGLEEHEVASMYVSRREAPRRI
ncbi:MAG: hypothetical protein AB1324_03490 [Candidatus Micrarchaeota archaeon]